MVKTNKIPTPIKRIIFLISILLLLFGVGVIAGNLKTINSIKIAFSNDHEINVLTTKVTVGEILKENHIEVLDDEVVVPSLETEIKDSMTIEILKKSEMNTISTLASKGENISLEELLTAYAPIVEKMVIEKIEIPYETITKDVSNGDSTTTEKIIQSGENGIREVTYKVKYQNDVEVERLEISSKVIKEPTNKIVQIQKKETPAPATTSRSSAVRETAVEPVNKLAGSVQNRAPKVVTLNASAYCPCYKCCNKTDAVTASGEKATAWYTIAAGNAYPLGTVIYIPALSGTANGGWFVVQDRGGAISSNKIDIFVASHDEALNFGRKNLECYIYSTI